MLYQSPQKIPPILPRPGIFIAGGISDCPDWQQEIISLIDTKLYDVINPRRVAAFSKLGLEAEEQITWEYTALNEVDNCIFWFPKNTVCPIALFELGKMIERAEHHTIRLAIGWDENYQRALDLKIQIGLIKNVEKYIIHAKPGWKELCAVVSKVWG